MMSYINETDFVIENKELVYPEIITDGLQLYYDAKGKRDTDYHRDTMLDMSGNKNHGELQNFAYEKHSGYKDGLVFDYIDDKLVRPELNLQPDDLTFMLNGNIISFSPDGTVKRVQDGEVIESKGFNMVRNGDFVDGWSGWHRPVATDTVKVTKGLATIRAGQQYGGLSQGLSSSSKMPSTGEKYYFCANVERESSNVHLYLNDGRSQTSAAGPNIGFISNIRILSDSPTTLAIKLQDNRSSGWTESKISDVIVINLTEAFGAGNEPTKEQMDEIIHRFGFIPNAQDLINRIEYKGNDLGDMENIIDGLYKTEVLSGEKIYTDKSDDAVVHVEIDGKSYQHAGSGKNIASGGWISRGMINYLNGSIGAGSVFAHTNFIEVKPNTSYIAHSKDILSETLYVITYDSDKNYIGFGGYGKKTTESNAKYIAVRGRDDDNPTFDLDSDIQLEEGSIATAYEPPAPTPDYPIEIHNLNDFDVVSSIGGRNLLKDSSKEKTGSREYVMYTNIAPVFDEHGVGQYTFSFDIKAAVAGGVQVYCTDRGTSSIKYTYNETAFQVTTEYKRYSMTVDVKELTSTASHTSLAFYGYYDSGRIPIIKNVKIEKGNKATDWTPALEEISENDNHPLIDKINLLLDEPLRSLGDVKDKLFRDNDGLWKVERNVWAQTLNGSTVFQPSATAAYNGSISTNRFTIPEKGARGAATSNWERSSHTTHSDRVWENVEGLPGTSINTFAQYHLRLPNDLLDINISDSSTVRHNKYMNYLQSEFDKGTPVVIQYILITPYTETLSQSLQDKLNNLRSFEGSNYVYTILPDEVNNLSENLKPTLHAKFLYNNWYKEDRVINNLMIYNRALTNEEMIQNYKTIKRRWGM